MGLPINDLSAQTDALSSGYGELRALHVQNCYEHQDHIRGPVNGNAMPTATAAPGNQEKIQAVGLGTN